MASLSASLSLKSDLNCLYTSAIMESSIPASLLCNALTLISLFLLCLVVRLLPISVSHRSVGQPFHVKVPIGANPFPIDFWHYELTSVFSCEPNSTGDGVRNIVTPPWWMIDAVFATSTTAALQSAQFIFQLLVIQQLNLATADN